MTQKSRLSNQHYFFVYGKVQIRFSAILQRVLCLQLFYPVVPDIPEDGALKQTTIESFQIFTNRNQLSSLINPVYFSLCSVTEIIYSIYLEQTTIISTQQEKIAPTSEKKAMIQTWG